MIRQTDNGEPFQAFIPVYCTSALPVSALGNLLILILFLFQLYLYFLKQMCVDYLYPNCQWSTQTNQLHLGSLPLKVEMVSQIRKHPWHRRWASHVACEAWRSSAASFPENKAAGQRAVQYRHKDLCCPRGTSAAAAFGEAVGDHHSESSTAWRNNAVQVRWRLC